MHNGGLAEFGSVKRELTFSVDPSLYPDIQGTTDSEVLFHLALTLGLQEDPIAGMEKAIQMVESVGREHGVIFPMQGTVAVSDGRTLWAFRYSSQHQTRTLFHSVDISTLEEMYPEIEALRTFGKHAHVVVSEPLNDLPGAFVEVAESTVAILDASGYHHRPSCQASGIAAAGDVETGRGRRLTTARRRPRRRDPTPRHQPHRTTPARSRSPAGRGRADAEAAARPTTPTVTSASIENRPTPRPGRGSPTRPSS